jgi:hypothetical protein
MYENMTIWCLGSISDAFGTFSEALSLVFDEHHTESTNCLVSNEEQGRRALTTRISYIRQRET